MTITKTLDDNFLATVRSIGQDETNAWKLMGEDNAFRSPIMRLVDTVMRNPTAYVSADAEAIYAAFTEGRIVQDNARKAGLSKLGVSMALARKPHGLKTWEAFQDYWRADNKPKTGSVYEAWLKHARTARDATNVVLTTDDPNAPPIPAGMIGVDSYLATLFAPKADASSDPAKTLGDKLKAEAKRLAKLAEDASSDVATRLTTMAADMERLAYAAEHGISVAAAMGQTMEPPKPTAPVGPEPVEALIQVAQAA